MGKEEIEKKIIQLMQEVDLSAAKHNMLLGQLQGLREILAEIIRIETEANSAPSIENISK